MTSPVPETLRPRAAARHSGDGLGQSFLTDLIWLMRFRSYRGRSTSWRHPEAADSAAWMGHAGLSRFGDGLFAVATSGDHRLWVLERLWHGWPDAPRFAFVALAADGGIRAAADFSRWPPMWTEPETRA